MVLRVSCNLHYNLQPTDDYTVLWWNNTEVYHLLHDVICCFT